MNLLTALRRYLVNAMPDILLNQLSFLLSIEDVQGIIDKYKSQGHPEIESFSYLPSNLRKSYLESISGEKAKELVYEYGQCSSFKNSPELKKLSERAFKHDFSTIQFIPDNHKSKWMVEDVIKKDMEYLKNIPVELLSENELISGIQNYKQQDAFRMVSTTGDPESIGYIEFEQKIHETVLQFIPFKLRTEAICIAALKANPENVSHIPCDIHETVCNRVSGKLPENGTADEWSDLCSKHPYLVWNRKVPASIAQNPSFWNKLDRSFFKYRKSELNFLPKIAYTLEVCKKAVAVKLSNFKYVPGDIKMVIDPLSVRDFLSSDKTISETYPRLEFLTPLPVFKELDDIVRSDKSRGYSMYDCVSNMPEKIRDVYVNSISHDQVVELMSDYIQIRFTRESEGDFSIYGNIASFEYYTNSKSVSPSTYLPEGSLSVADWHQLCSQTTELISEGIVPNEIISNNQFWDNYADFIDKGSFLSNPDKEPIHTFDEYLFLKMPREVLSNTDILMDLFSKGLTDPSLLPSKMLSKELYLSFSPKYYREIPEEFRVTSEFKDTARQAFKYDIYNIPHIPDLYKDSSMFEEIAKRDMRLLTYVPVNLINEDTLLSGIQYLNKQDIFSARPDPAEPGLVKHEQEQVKKILQFIPEEFRTEKVCIAALYHSRENLKYIPDAIRHTLSFKDGKVTQSPLNVRINQQTGKSKHHLLVL